ncbi:DinB family protein [Kribbella sp. NPDC050124]|uniref:DinB family protein n=1 Tax=Kribbella sp. NPDC050124 TaxID=3364114 RepID=UPI0037AA5680
MDRNVTHEELEAARRSFHELIEGATAQSLRRPSNGTRWNNRQLLFHMLLGYLIIRALLRLARIFDRLPTGASEVFARTLNAGTKPFDAVNFLGSYAGGTAMTPHRMELMFDHVVDKLHRRLDAETDTDLNRGMCYPTRWDPFFKHYMTLADLYRFPTQHFNFHRHQLTLNA